MQANKSDRDLTIQLEPLKSEFEPLSSVRSSKFKSLKNQKFTTDVPKRVQQKVPTPGRKSS